MIGAGYWLRGGGGSTPRADDSAEASFARDMLSHHDQAVEMARAIRERSRDPELLAVAYDIITSQQHEIGQLYAWLNDWSLPQSSARPAMSWLADDPMPRMTSAGHGGMLIPRPPFARDGLTRGPRQTGHDKGPSGGSPVHSIDDHPRRGRDRDGEAVLARTERPRVVELAEAITKSQAEEIRALQGVLDARAARTSPDAGKSIRMEHHARTRLQYHASRRNPVDPPGCLVASHRHRAHHAAIDRSRRRSDIGATSAPYLPQFQRTDIR